MTDWNEKVIVVTGASAGLGKAIAKAFAQRGARVALVARHPEPLDRLVESLSKSTGSMLAIPADVTRDDDAARVVEQVVAKWGRIDMLVNCAGISMRGRLSDTGVDEFQRLLDLNLLAVVRLTRLALTHLVSARGSVVNIGSLAAKSAAKFLGAYPASKFALSAYTQQLRLEHADDGLHVLLVCPGPIARDAPRQYVDADAADLPEEVHRPGGGVKTNAIDPDALAERIIRACEKRRPELVVPWKARLLFAISQLSPRLGDWLVTKNT